MVVVVIVVLVVVLLLLLLLPLLLLIDFIEFETNECVSDDKETINKLIQNRV